MSSEESNFVRIVGSNGENRYRFPDGTTFDAGYCVSATFGHHALTETDDPVDAARAFHAIHAEDRPFVIKVRNSQARPNGSGQLIAQTASSSAGGKSCYGKWAGNGDPAFSSAYRLLLESGGR